jgi:hypothetical protein
MGLTMWLSSLARGCVLFYRLCHETVILSVFLFLTECHLQGILFHWTVCQEQSALEFIGSKLSQRKLTEGVYMCYVCVP